MRVDEPEVVDAVREPEVDQPDNGHGGRIAVKGRLKVVYRVDDGKRVVLTVLWEGTGDRSEGPLTHVPNKPSNRVFIEKLELWGCTIGRKRSDWVQIRTPGGRLLEVRPAGYSKGNPAKTLIEAYRSLGVSAEEFWARTVKVRPQRERVHAAPADLKFPRHTPEPTEPEPAPASAVDEKRPPQIDSIGGRVFAYYRGHPGEICDVEMVARDLGIEPRRVKQSLYFLHRDGHLEKVGALRYRYRRWGETDAAKASARADLAYAVDPANRLPDTGPRSTRTPPVKRRPLTALTEPKMGLTNGVTDMVFNYYRDRPGEILSMQTIATELGAATQQVNNAAGHLARTGRLEKVARGAYRYPAGDPLQRLDAIQARLDGAVPAEPEPSPDRDPTPTDPLPVPEPEPVPVGARPATGAHMATQAPIRRNGSGSVDDEIDALLELLVPGGLRARHLPVAAAWVAATRELLTLTRAER